MELQRDVFPNDSFEHFDQIAHHAVQVQRFELHDLFPTESQQLASEVGRPFGCQGDLAETIDRLGIEAGICFENLSIPLHHRQNVVKIMGDPAGKVTNGIHFL